MKKYFYVKLEGHEGVAFFKNEKKEGEQPDYRSKGGAGLWIREYDETKAKAAKEAKEEF